MRWMAGEVELVGLWRSWGIQALVLLSFTLQVALVILAEFRRWIDSGVLRFVWSAYMLADSTAIYVLGHMSVTGGGGSSSAAELEDDDELVALWAPFLLMHLGGQDNITAYAIEDNRLWLRHLQTLAVQAAAAAYVLYESSILSNSSSRRRRFGSGLLVIRRPAAIVMFVVGVLKYGERVWALRCAGNSTSGDNYRPFAKSTMTLDKWSDTRRLHPIVCSTGSSLDHPDTEACLLIAQTMVDVPKDLLQGPLPYVVSYAGPAALPSDALYKVVEMQLSLMHDAFYTKAEVTHTCYGLCIRIACAVATTVAFVHLVQDLFFHPVPEVHRASGGGRRRAADVAITCVLLVGALVLEITSALRALLSSQTCALLLQNCGVEHPHYGECFQEMCNSLGRALVSLRRLARAAQWRRRCCWSRTMGQHSLLQLWHRARSSRWSRVARWVGLEDPWNTLVHSSSITVPAFVEQLLQEHIAENASDRRSVPDDHGHLFNSRGPAALRSWGLHERHSWSVEETILVWHIATAVYTCWYKKQMEAAGDAGAAACRSRTTTMAEAVEALSNYMLFLLAARPYMLPAPANRNAYVEMCYGLSCLTYSSVDDLATSLKGYGDASLNTAASSSNSSFAFSYVATVQHSSLVHNDIFKTGCMLGAKLVGESERDHSPAAGNGDSMLELLLQVWAEMLCNTGHRCSAYSHARQLGSGGELITVAAILSQYFTKDII
ncbi:unnamed protein product [Urochloa decumbens]|uniref:DUF4220 domain-containing protein n=1 Tax=Urochloa decumbens TaxID=240449 RepID=A0ABC8Z045_9POAL